MSVESEKDQRHYVMEKQQNDYERIRDQCLSAMSELDTLRRGHAESLNHCEIEAQKAEYFRQQHKVVANKLEEQTKEFQILQTKYEQVSKDRNKYRQDYDEIVLLREQEMDQNENDAAPVSLSDLQKENEDLKDVKASYSLMSTKYKHSQEENCRLKEQFDVMASERDALAIERNALKQQCASAISGFEKALRDRDEAGSHFELAKKQCEIAARELEQAVKLKLQMSKDIIKLRDERNSALHEYKLVMSERDSVHQEIEKLQNDLGKTKNQAKQLSDDKEKVFLEKEGLLHEIKEVLADRDQAINEVHDLKARLQEALKEKETFAKKLEEQRQEFEVLKQERNAALKERVEALIYKDQILKESYEVKTMFAKMESGESDETENLKKQFSRLSNKLTDAWKSAEVARARRVWAFNERDKVVRELELTKEKYSREKFLFEERAKELTIEKNLSHKKYNELLCEVRENRLSKYLVSNVNKENMASSQDSAIDTEAPSYHIESVELERQCKDADFGFSIGGGCDAPLRVHDASIFVVKVTPGSIAENKLKVNDCILRVNGIDVTNIEHQVAYEAIFGSDNYLNVTILRQSKIGVKSPLQRVEIKSTEEKHIGLSIDSGLHIKRIEPGSAAAEEETLSIGDKILSVNGQSIENMSYDQAKKLLKTSNLSLTVLKPSVSTASSRRSLPQNIEDEKLISQSNEKLFANISTFSPHHHFRSPSAPIYASAASEQLLGGFVSHCRGSSSVVGQMSDDEIKKILAKLYAEEQRRQDGNDKTIEIAKFPFSGEEGKAAHKNEQFNLSLKKDHSLAPSINPQINAISPDPMQTQYRRPVSAHGSRQSVASSGSAGFLSHEVTRNTPSSPLNISRSDPLALSPRTFGQPSSVTTSNTSVNSSNRSVYLRRIRVTTARHSHGPTSLPDAAHGRIPSVHRATSDMFSSQNYSLGNVYEKPYGTFPRKHFDADRYAAYSNSQSASKPNSMRSFGHYKSCSSHGSLNSSEISDRAPSTLGNIEPVDEETDVSLMEFSSSPPVTLPRERRIPSKSPRVNERQSRQRSSSSPSCSNLRKNQKLQTNGHNESNRLEMEEEKPRVTVIEKGQNPLGITICQGQNNGVFVAGVHEESIASKVGLKYGDQLLEYNGINLRTASYDQAALILKQSAVENTVTVLAQYNPRKMQEILEAAPSSTQSTPRTPHKSMPTSPLNTPLSRRVSRGGTVPGTPVSIHVRINSNASSCSDHSKMTYNEIKITPIPEDDAVEEPRLIRIVREHPSQPLGIGIIGGNAIGIFISDIQKGSLAEQQPGLKCGDKILKYNAKDMLGNTLEEATLELANHTEVADFEVQYNPPGYLQAQSESGDLCYVRAMFDRLHPPKGELLFRKGDILHVSETLYKGQLGVWRATIVSENPDNEEYKKVKGKIPSKGKAEQELLSRRSCSDDKLKGRKSIFRRSKKSHHVVNHSRESSDSKADVEITSTVSSGTSFGFNSEDVVAYEFVRRYDSSYPRPVVVIGALVEPICDKLVMEYANDFSRCLPEISESTKDMMDVNINDGTYVDYKLSRKGDRYECITPQAIKDVIYGKFKHCLLDINPEALEKLLQLHLHPIVIFIRYKNPKHIKELKEGHYIKEKLSNKSAKDLYDMFVRLEKDYKHHITASLTCHSLSSICKEITECVQEHQRKTLWISAE